MTGRASRIRAVMLCAAVAAGTAVLGASTRTVAAPEEAPPAKARPWDVPSFSGEPGGILAAAAAEPPAPDTGSVVLLEEIRVSYDEAGRNVKTFHTIYRIVLESDLEGESTVSALWKPWYQERPVLRARVITPDGATHELDPATIDESPAQDGVDLYDDRRILRAPLPAVSVGSVVETELVIKNASPYFEPGEVGYYVLGGSLRTVRSRFVLDAPASLPLHYRTGQLPGMTPQKTELGGRVTLTFDAGPLAPAPDPEAYVPSDVQARPYVAYTTGRSWKDIASAYARIVDAQIAGAELAGAAKEASRGASSRAEKIDRILGWVRKEVRYTGIEFNDAAIVPNKPAEILKRKYGDCKDQASMLVGLLRAAGIPAHVALLSVGGGPDVEPELPGMGGFDHAIVRLDGSPEVWIDPTSPYARAGEIPYQDQGRLALVADAATETLVLTPRATAAENRLISKREVTLVEDGHGRFNDRVEAHGSLERLLRDSYASLDPSAARARLEAQVKQSFLAKGLTSYKFQEPKDLSAPFWRELDASECRRAATGPLDAAVGIAVSEIGDRLYPILDETGDATSDEDPKKRRKQDFVYPGPYAEEWRYRIHPPPGYSPNRFPDGGVETFQGATLTTSYATAEDGTVEATFRFEMTKPRLSPDELRTFRKEMKGLHERKPVVVTFKQVGEGLLSSGKVREALEEFRRLSAMHPKEALHRSQIAKALEAGGLGEAARLEARRAVELDPDSARARFRLAYTLQRDLVGRLRGKGFDRAGAVAAYRKAKELDPQDPLARGELAILLEHDDEGERYTDKADMAGAIDEYRALIKDLDNHAMDANLMIVLGRARRWSELETFARSLDASTERSVSILVAVAELRGADAALEEAQGLAPEPDKRRSVLAAVGVRLMGSRDYALASKFMIEGVKGASNSADMLTKAELIGRTKRFEDVVIDDSDPASVMKRYFIVMVKGTKDEKVFRDLVSKDAPEKVVSELHDPTGSLRRIRRTTGQQLASTGMNAESVFDLTLSMIQTHAEGNDALGYRISGSLPIGTTQLGVVFVVQEGGRYRILTTDDHLGVLGKRALAKLDAGDAAGARQYLSWARDAISSSAAADDPMAGEPVHRLYPASADEDLEAARLAAAALVAGEPGGEAGIAMLDTCRTDNQDAARRTNCALALASAYAALERWDDLDKVVASLLPAAPDSSLLYRRQQRAAFGRHAFRDARVRAEARLARHPDDATAIRDLDVASQAEPFDIKPEWSLKHLVDIGKADEWILNELAWSALCTGKAGDEALDYARRAVAKGGGGTQTSGALHTLAALYADTGHPAEAYSTLLESMEKSGEDEPRHIDWYVIGRLAELYGEPGAASPAYKRVEKPKDPAELPMSTFTLAQKRLSALPGGTAAH